MNTTKELVEYLNADVTEQQLMNEVYHLVYDMYNTLKPFTYAPWGFVTSLFSEIRNLSARGQEIPNAFNVIPEDIKTGVLYRIYHVKDEDSHYIGISETVEDAHKIIALLPRYIATIQQYSPEQLAYGDRLAFRRYIAHK